MEVLTETVVLGNRLSDYIISVVIFLACVFLIKFFEYVMVKHFKKITQRTQTSFDDFLVILFQKSFLPFLYYGAFYFSMHSLILDPTLKKGMYFLIMAVMTFYITRLIILLLNYGFDVYLRKSKKTAVFENSMRGILRVLRIVIWGMAVVFFLDNLGFKISAVVAGLGIGGVAVALAAQAVLGDLFSYFAILFDRPFEIGDFIIVGDFMGVVEHMGIKTTRITSLGGEQLVFSNTDLTSSRIRNYKRMEKRRVLFKLGVTYNTPLAKLKEIPGLIKEIISGVEDTVFDRAHFSAYGDFNLVIEIVYYVIGPDYNKYMDIQQRINFEIKEAFEKKGIEFAFPTQTLYVSQTGE